MCDFQHKKETNNINKAPKLQFSYGCEDNHFKHCCSSTPLTPPFQDGILKWEDLIVVKILCIIAHTTIPLPHQLLITCFNSILKKLNPFGGQMMVA